MATRPLSPHLQVYKFMYTMVLSITHRITGVALGGGFALFVAWLVALALGTHAYASYGRLLGSPLGLLLVAGFIFAVWYHTMNGIRHMVWDTGRALDKRGARLSGLVMVLATLACVAVSYLAVWRLAGGAP